MTEAEQIVAELRKEVKYAISHSDGCEYLMTKVEAVITALKAAQQERDEIASNYTRETREISLRAQRAERQRDELQTKLEHIKQLFGVKEI